MHKSLYRKTLKEMVALERLPTGHRYLSELAYVLNAPNGRHDVSPSLFLGKKDPNGNSFALRAEFEAPLENPAALGVRMQEAFWLIKRLGQAKELAGEDSERISNNNNSDSSIEGEEGSALSSSSLTERAAKPQQPISDELEDEDLFKTRPSPGCCPPVSMWTDVEQVPDLFRETAPIGIVRYFRRGAPEVLPSLIHEDGVNSSTPVVDSGCNLVHIPRGVPPPSSSSTQEERSDETTSTSSSSPSSKKIATSLRFNAAGLSVKGSFGDGRDRLFVTLRTVRDTERVVNLNAEQSVESQIAEAAEKEKVTLFNTHTDDKVPTLIQVKGIVIYAMHPASGEYVQVFNAAPKDGPGSIDDSEWAPFETTDQTWRAHMVVPIEFPAILKAKVYYTVQGGGAIPDETAVAAGKEEVLIADIPPCDIAA